MTEPEKTLPFALLARYRGVRPRLTAFLHELQRHPDPMGEPTPVEQALAAELIATTRRPPRATDSVGRCACCVLAKREPARR